MNINRIENAFFFLLKSGLWGKVPLVGNVFPLKDQEWSQVFQKAKEQTVEGILFDGLQFLSDDNLPPTAIRLSWMVRIHYIECNNERLNRLIAEQYHFFCKLGLDPLLLKGQGVATSYPQPLHRSSGDVDWCFEDLKQYRLAQLALLKKGAAVATENGQTIYRWEESEIDLHQRLFDLHNPFSRSFISRMRPEFGNALCNLAGHNIPILHPLLQVIQVAVHILKHSLSFGVGLRQYCDLACLYNRYVHELDHHQLKNIYRRLGLLNWIEAVHGLLVACLGLPTENLPFSNNSEILKRDLIDDIWNFGNFGFHHPAFVEKSDDNFYIRRNRWRLLFWRFLKYARFAPFEAIWFPIVHAQRRRITEFNREKQNTLL